MSGYLRLNDYAVPGHGLMVGAGFELKKSDISGDSSTTAKAAEGTKAKKFSVTTFINYANDADLKELVRVAQAEDENEGTARIYTITNTTANAMGVRQVTFSGQFKVDEQEGLRHWKVSFTLDEHNSVPEMIENRKQDPDEQLQPAPGEPIEAEEELTGFEKWLVETDKKIGA